MRIVPAESLLLLSIYCRTLPATRRHLSRGKPASCPAYKTRGCIALVCRICRLIVPVCCTREFIASACYTRRIISLHYFARGLNSVLMYSCTCLTESGDTLVSNVAMKFFPRV